MSLFGWFTNKRVQNRVDEPDSSGLGHIDATVPLTPSDRAPVKLAHQSGNHAANRKTERMERRELVYGTVRDSMTRAGVLATSYKFKVLSLDAAGQQYLIMMDLANQSAGDTGRLSEIEALIAQSAKIRHGILVTAVYWRVNEHVTSGLSPNTTGSGPLAPRESGLSTPAASAPTSGHVAPELKEPAVGPLQDEVAVFKRAWASALPAASMSAPGEIVKSGPRTSAVAKDFEDTQLVVPDERSSPLSVTQYGDLN